MIGYVLIHRMQPGRVGPRKKSGYDATDRDEEDQTYVEVVV